MLIETLVTAFVVIFAAIAVFGHLLLLRAAVTPVKPRQPSQDAGPPSHHAPVARARVAA